MSLSAEKGLIRNELNKETALCTPEGSLNPGAVGWSRFPVHVCNLSGNYPRKKRWDYWCVTNPDFLFSVTIADVDYALSGFIYFLDFATKRFIEQTVVIPFPGPFQMPPMPAGQTELTHRSMKLAFSHQPQGITLIADAPKFGGERMSAEIMVQKPRKQESLNVVVPWNDRQFQFTSKQPCLPASGTVQIGPRKYTFDSRNSFACLDFGRGIWPFSTSWNWASFSAKSGRDTIGINLGGQWTDGTGANENGILLNGKLFKLFEDVTFDYDKGDFMRPWKIRTKNSDSVQLEFTPFFERKALTNLLIVYTDVHQMIGRFRGRIKAGSKWISVNEAVGWAEDHVARW